MGIAQSGHQERVGRVVRTAPVLGLTVAGGCSVVSVASPGGTGRDLVLKAAPDAALARRFTTGMRRLAWVRIDATGAEPRCEVFGVARRPCHRRLPLAAALALADANVRTVVRVSDAT